MPKKNEYELQLQDGNTITVQLSWKDRIMRFFYSKEEFQAYMLQKIEAKKNAAQQSGQATSQPQPSTSSEKQ